MIIDGNKVRQFTSAGCEYPSCLDANSLYVALIGPEIEENLALRYLAAALEHGGIRAEIISFNGSEELKMVAEQIMTPPHPFLVAISLAFQARAMDSLALAVHLRNCGYRGHITGGGHFGSFTWEQILRDFPEIDSICLFEAEETLTELARALIEQKPLNCIAGLATRTNHGNSFYCSIRPPPHLSKLPWPDRRGEPVSCLGHRVAPLVASRGCYGNCKFCCIASMHKMTSPALRHRLREIEDVADEMAWLKEYRGIDIFVFHDDNFFLPTHRKSIERINALSDALAERKIGKFAICVKARPNDISNEICRIMRDRLGLIRLFLGVETDTLQGLATLGRKVVREQNHSAMKILAEEGIYVCFNMLIFDPDATIESLHENLSFMEAHADLPFNFGRVELYAGTPLLSRMQAEGRCRGNYVICDYSMADAEMQRIFEITNDCFFERNFAPGALANRLMETRFDVEVCRFFHPDIFMKEWYKEARELSQKLAFDSISGIRKIIEHVITHPVSEDFTFKKYLRNQLRTTEEEILNAAINLENKIQDAVGVRCHHFRDRFRGSQRKNSLFLRQMLDKGGKYAEKQKSG